MTIAAAEVIALPDAGVKVKLPVGSELMFFADDHSYWRVNDKGSRGKRLTGVTTVCKTLDPDPQRLLAWAAKTQLIGVAELARRLEPDARWLYSQETIQAALEDARLTFEDVRNTAAARGTTIHVDVFEALANGRDPQALIDPDTLTLDARMAMEGALAFWRDYQPQPLLVEQIVYAERLGVAGRLDLYGTIRDRKGPGILDWKTGKHLFSAAHAQVGGGYPLLMEESGWPKPEWAAMVKIADGGYELVEAEGTVKHFEAAVAAYRASGEINNAASRARREREKAAA